MLPHLEDQLQKENSIHPVEQRLLQWRRLLQPSSKWNLKQTNKCTTLFTKRTIALFMWCSIAHTQRIALLYAQKIK